MIDTIASIILFLLTATPNAEFVKDSLKRTELASTIVQASNKYDQPAVLLVVWYFEESSLKQNALGKKGERGISQIHPSNFCVCRKLGYDVDTMRGQVLCGAALADMWNRYCGDMKRGWYKYASGRSCKGTPRARRITERRFKRWRRLENKFNVN